MKHPNLFIQIFSTISILFVYLSLSQINAQESIGNNLSGTIFNVTKDSLSDIKIPVTLTQYPIDNSPIITKITSIDGKFQFNNLEMNLVKFSIKATYQKVLYEKNILLDTSFLEPIELLIYETTSELKGLKIEDETMVITGINRRYSTMGILQSIKVSNTTNQTFLPAPEETGPMGLFRVSLLPGAENLEVQTSLPTGGHIIQVNQGVALTLPIPPGNHEFIIIYRTSYFNETLSYDRRFTLPTSIFRIMLPVNLGSIISESMIVGSTIKIGNTNYLNFTASEKTTEERLQAVFFNLPKKTFIEKLLNFTEKESIRQLAIPITTGIVLISFLGIRLRKFIKIKKNESSQRDDKSLEHSLLSLDSEYTKGSIPHDRYIRMRKDLKDQLSKLDKQEY